ncbi:MAG: hypothetical protein GQ474_08105 [Sulfurimonas sp.]|nr:hypothetical protein [Sulfurimonas sp.]
MDLTAFFGKTGEAVKKHNDALSAFSSSPKAASSPKKKKTLADFTAKELEEMPDEEYLALFG